MFIDAGFENQCALVSGGAKGIGRAIVTILAKHGMDVTFIYNQSQQAAEQFVDECTKQGWNVRAYQADVTNPVATSACVQEMIDRTGRCDLLVNNSGVVRDNLLAALEFEEIKTVLDTNILGAMNLTKAVVPFMMRKRQGHIINISSVGGEKPGRGQSNYAASKGAINAFTKAMAVELAARNIRVNAIAPGVINTDMSKTVRELAEEEVLGKILLKQFGEPEDIANAVAFLASKYGRYINGEILHVDGGFKMA